jgi:heme exporter protein D
MMDVEFVTAAYAVILLVLALYVVVLWRRLRAARDVSLRIRREAAEARTDRDRGVA